MQTRSILSCVLGLILSGSALADICYVDASAAGGNDGSTWPSAYTSLQSALGNAVCTEIRVASGTYKPGSTRQDSFVLTAGVELYGGFPTGGGNWEARDWVIHETILSGDIDDSGTLSGNSYNVVHIGYLGSAVLDGFTITGGNADHSLSELRSRGGGLQVEFAGPMLSNLNISGNAAKLGGGIHITGSWASEQIHLENTTISNNEALDYGGGIFALSFNNGLMVNDVTISSNKAGFGGGGVFYNNTTANMTNVRLIGNSARRGAVGSGGGIYNLNSSLILKNAALSGNYALQGAGMYSRDSSPTLVNATFSGNLASGNGGGMALSNSSPVLTNVLMWNNRVGSSSSSVSASISRILAADPDISFSMIANCNPGGTWNTNCGVDGGDNLADVDPLFLAEINPAAAPTTAGNLGLLPGSPVIDTGDSAANDSIVDAAGNERVVDSVIDLGAYEYSQFDCPNGGIVYVSEQAANPSDGSSWTTAYTDLQSALLVRAPCQVHVSSGTYVPGILREDSFQLISGVEIYGGFPPEGGDWENRDWGAHETILSGDIDNSGTLSGNSYHVVLGSNADPTAVLDGFIVSGGNANTGSGADALGGGMRTVSGSPTLANLTFTGNAASRGGGMYNVSGSHPTLTNIVFSGNRATEQGGGMYNNNSSSPALTNVSFSGNDAVLGGGAIGNGTSSPTLVNVIIWNNRAEGSTNGRLASISNNSSSPLITHSLIAHCNPGGSWDGNCGTDGGANLADADPRFMEVVDPGTAPTPAGNLRLLPGSPVIDTGDNSANDSNFDLAGNPRIHNGLIDLGAYEFSGSFDCPPDGMVHVGQQATQSPNGLTWESAFDDLQLALTVAGPCEIRVAAGTYVPGTERADSFQLKNNVAIYGGFPPGGGNWEDRNWAGFETILTGDIDNSGDLNNNSYHVVLGNFTDETAVLDGFTITGGNADAPSGAGALGGGIRNVSGSPTLVNLLIRENSALRGGGMYAVTNSFPTLINVAFSGNAATDVGGGLYNNNNSAATLINASFSGNSAGVSGGAIGNNSSSATLTNVVIWNNQVDGSNGTTSASIFNGAGSSADIAYSLIENCNPGGVWNSNCGSNIGNNLADDDPLFALPIDPATAPTSAGDLRLAVASPAIDAGDDSVNDTGFGLGGNPRILGTAIDPGAYETPYVTATASVDGQGSVDLAPDAPRFTPGTEVTLTAAPDSGWSFTGWSGDASSGDNPLVWTLNEDLAVTAHFEINSYPIDISIDPPAGGTASCTPNPVEHGGQSTCTAQAASGYSFTGWSGDCAGPDCELENVTEAVIVTAHFELNTYTVGGTVSGLAGEGLVLLNNGGDDLTIGSDGPFEFDTTLADGSSYEVTIVNQPADPDQICTISNGSGTVEGNDVTDIAVDCATTFTVGGAVSGLKLPGLVLDLNGESLLLFERDSTYTFFPGLPDGADYEVTAPMVPDEHDCTIANASGTIGDTDVVDVNVSCTTDIEFADDFESLSETPVVLD